MKIAPLLLLTFTGSLLAATVPEASDPWELFDGRLRWNVQERVRFESRSNHFDFDDSRDTVTDDSFFLQRFRLGFSAKPAEGMEIKLEGQDSREFDSERPNVPGALGAEGDDEFDLRQAWISLGDKKAFPFVLQAGRMAWKYGDERLLGDFEWNNIGRTFDGLVGHLDLDGSSLDLLFGSPVIIKPTEFNTSDGHDRLVGTYYSTKQWLDQTTEFYLFYRNHNNAINNGQAQETWTPGLRFKSIPEKYGNWDYEMELAGQAGKVTSTLNRSLDHYAFASHVQGGYIWRDVKCKPAVTGFYDFASGDENPLDDEDTGFQNLFPTNHKFYGGMDLFAWRNLHDFGLSAQCKPFKDVALKAEVHSFWLPETADAWYRANGFTAVRPTAAGRNVDAHVGEEIDLTAGWQINRFLNVGAGFGHFSTGEFVRSTGTSSDAQFGYVMFNAGF